MEKETSQEEVTRSKDTVLGRKILVGLAQRKSVSAPFPSILDLSGRVYAIHGESNAGRTVLATDACVSALFRGSAVVFVDSDYRFNVIGFLDRVKQVCTSRNLPATHFKSACRNLIVQKCGTSTELQLFLSFKLREILKTSNVGLVVVDSLTTFFWHDRYSRSKWKAFYDSIWMNLERLRNEFGFTLIVTIQDLYSEQKTPHNFLHCPGVPVESIRIRKLGHGIFNLVNDSSERSVCEMQDGTLKKIDPSSLTE